MILDSVVKVRVEFIRSPFFEYHRFVLTKDLQFFSLIGSEILSEMSIGFYEL